MTTDADAPARVPLMIAGSIIWVKHEVVPIESIRLNPDNPRVRFLIERQSGTKKLSLDELMAVIRDQPGYDSLQKSIRKAGGISDPVIVSHDGLVIEGNTRTTVFATLHNCNKTDVRWQRMPVARLGEDVSASAIGILMASYHVAGKTVWRPYAQADHIYRLHTLHGRSFEEIADATRMQPGKVEQYLEAYKYLVNEVLPHADIGQEREVLEKRFHHALEFVSRRNLAELRNDPEVRQDLAKLLVENKIKGAEVRELDKVLKHRTASSALKKSGFTAAKNALREIDPVAASRELQEMKAFTRRLCKMGQDHIAMFRESNPAQEVLRELAEAVRNIAAVANVKLGD